MENLKKFLLVTVSCLALMPALLPSASYADPGSEYCVTPAFVSGNIPPNLLLMIDNSASMYDLAYVDRGKKHCSGSATACFSDADCTSPQTCSVFDRQPFYCYDQTFQSSSDYYGYFEKEKFYYYRIATDDFAPAAGATLAAVTAAAPSTCGTGAGNTTKTFPGNMCVEYTPAKTLVSFVAKGNYLNWLTASKFDTEKQILTGGKFDGSAMIPESRGCVGQGFVKDANTADFVNFSDSDGVDPNVSLKITFTVAGPSNLYNPTAPSTGGQTYINLFAGNEFDYGACQEAIKDLATGSNAEIKQSVDDCLQSTATADGYCGNVPVALRPTSSLDDLGACSANSDCYLLKTSSPPPYVCQKNVSQTCSGTADTSCDIPARNSCSLDPGYACTATSECTVTVAAVSGTCSTSRSKYSPTPGGSWSLPVTTCTTDAECDFTHGSTSFTALAGACVGSVPASTIDKGTCVMTAATDFGPCTANYVGDCVVSAEAAAVKTKVGFQQSMQECWTIRGETHTAADNYGFPNMNTVKNQCPDIYASYKTCHNNHLKQCSVNTDCAADGTVTCDSGPDAIAAGNPALLCGSNYTGQFFEKNASGNWVMKAAATDLQLAEAQYRFCGDMAAPSVTDPTDSPSDTTVTDNLPAIISGLGVEAQLGTPIRTMRAKIAAGACAADSDCGADFSCSGAVCTPIGLIQQFAGKMRIGAMSFNPYGSASETALAGVKIPKVCKSGGVAVVPAQSCTQDIDCGTGKTCGDTVAHSTNLDGGRIDYPVGKGVCATMTTTPCTSDAQCSGMGVTCTNTGFCGTLSSTVCTTALTCSGAATSRACIRNSAGEHTTAESLVKSIDSIPANAWTPLAETFYNALGYFAAIPQADSSFKSRVAGAAAGVTGLRLNALNTTSTTFTSFAAAPVDFNEALNPSEYRCQQNYLLMISDGSSTADRNPDVSALATLYAAQSGATAGNCAVAAGEVDHGGTSNLPILSWIGKRQNLASFSTSAATPLHCSSHTSTVCAADADCPVGESCTNAIYPRDFFTTYVVFNGADTGSAGVCSAATLLGKTASNGGTTLQQASDPAALRTALTGIFQNIAAKAASGTAASILSNSEGSGANILQAVFFPKKVFANQTNVNWIGEMQNLWYFVDPLINRSTIREDSNSDRILNLISDNVVSFRFDSSDNTTYAYLSTDTNGDGLGDTVEVKKDSDLVKSVWRAGKQLWSRDLSARPRKIKTTLNGTSLIDLSSATFPGELGVNNAATLAPYLNLAAADAPKLINYVHGVDQAGLRSRTVSIKDPATNVVTSNVWRLGDIISSTPRIQSTAKLNGYSLLPPSGYTDTSYSSFIASNEYKTRGMVYVGANDGMIHAFKLGLLDVTASGYKKAQLSGTGLGEEEWAFVPKHALPYLKYYSDPDYNHIYYVDGSTVLLDASIGVIGGCTAGTYDQCVKQVSVVDGSNQIDTAKNTWMSVLIGGMGLGGASTNSCASGANCVQTPLADPADATKGFGYSSYFALNVTNPTQPSLLWEFNNPALGYASTGPAIVRVGERDKNGRWYAVFGSGPTGPIDTVANQFLGRSNQTLKFFVVDLRSGALVRTIDTGIAEAFAGSMVGGAIDADRWNPDTTGNYQDDAIYVGFTKKSAGGTWTDGGVIRIVTKETSTVTDWTWSKVVDDTGPVTTAISRLQDRKNKNLWLYFGTGRYFNRSGSTIDDFDSQRHIYGIKDPCYNTDAHPGNMLDKTCSATVSAGITDQSDTVSATVGAGGWKIDLDLAASGYGAERVVTDAVALTNGTVFLTSFQPTADPCGFGGNSFLWALDYKTGGRPQDTALAGKALIQLSTGEFKEVNLSEAFGAGAARLMRRTSVPMTGKPPADAFPIVSKSGNKPVKRILHIQER